MQGFPTSFELANHINIISNFMVFGMFSGLWEMDLLFTNTCFHNTSLT